MEHEHIGGSRVRFPPGRVGVRLDERHRAAYRRLYGQYATVLSDLPVLRDGDFDGRLLKLKPGQLKALNRAFAQQIPEAAVVTFGPPAIPGLGTGAGFTMQLQDRSGGSPEFLAQQATRDLREVEGLALMVQEVLARVTRLTSLLGSIGTVGQVLGVAQGLRKGVDVFIRRLARRRGVDRRSGS